MKSEFQMTKKSCKSYSSRVQPDYLVGNRKRTGILQRQEDIFEFRYQLIRTGYDVLNSGAYRNLKWMNPECDIFTNLTAMFKIHIRV